MTDRGKLAELEARLQEVRRSIDEGRPSRARSLREVAGRLADGDPLAEPELRRLAHRLRGVLDPMETALAEQARRVELELETGPALVAGARALADLLERPRVEAATPIPAAPAAAPVATRLGLRVLALDDDDATRRLLTLSLVRIGGCEAEVLSDPEEALARLRAGGVELLIVDAMMPAVTGLELYRAVRLELGPSLAVAFLSAASPDELGWTLPKDPRVVWLRKPFRPPRLIAELVAFVGGLPP